MQWYTTTKYSQDCLFPNVCSSLLAAVFILSFDLSYLHILHWRDEQLVKMCYTCTCVMANKASGSSLWLGHNLKALSFMLMQPWKGDQFAYLTGLTVAPKYFHKVFSVTQIAINIYLSWRLLTLTIYLTRMHLIKVFGAAVRRVPNFVQEQLQTVKMTQKGSQLTYSKVEYQAKMHTFRNR